MGMMDFYDSIDTHYTYENDDVCEYVYVDGSIVDHTYMETLRDGNDHLRLYISYIIDLVKHNIIYGMAYISSEADGTRYIYNGDLSPVEDALAHGEIGPSDACMYLLFTCVDWRRNSV